MQVINIGITCTETLHKTSQRQKNHHNCTRDDDDEAASSKTRLVCSSSVYLKLVDEVVRQRASVRCDRHIAVKLSQARACHFGTVAANIILSQEKLHTAS